MKLIPKWSRPVGRGVLITLMLVLVNVSFEQTAPGRWLEFRTFELLNSFLPAFDQERLPVVVIDISQVPGSKEAVTPRQTLRELIEAIADQEPAAIALDIDFSPDDNGFKSDEDPKFLEFCLQVSAGKRADGRSVTRVPVFVGVGREQGETPETCLGVKENAKLGAAMYVDAGDTREMPRWVMGKTAERTGGLRSMSEALAEKFVQAHETRLPLPPAWLCGTVSVIHTNPADAKSPLVGGEEERQEGLRLGLSPVNYSKLEEMRRETLHVRSAQPVREAGVLFQNRPMVIIGDTEVADTFAVPGPLPPVKGALLHACAAYSFAKSPLCEFKSQVRIIADVLLSLLLIVIFQVLHHRYPQEDEQHHKSRIAHVGILSSVLLAGALLVRWCGILWLDFIPIVVALALHPALENGLEAWLEQRHREEDAQRPTPPP